MLEAVEIFRAIGDSHWLSLALNNIASLELYDRRLSEARNHLDEAIRAVPARSVDNSVSSLLHYNAGLVMLLQGDLEAALASLTESFTIAERVGARDLEASSLLGLALHASAIDHYQHAATIHGLSAALYEQLAEVIQPGDARLADEDRTNLQNHMGVDAFDRAFRAGTAHAPTWWQTDRQTKLALVFADQQPGHRSSVEADPAAAEVGSTAAKLSRRERELLDMVADGLTDDQIAQKMFISIRTVHSHLDRIRDKTGARRRAELTRLALDSRPT